MSLVKTPVSNLQELLQKYNQIPQYSLILSDGLGTHNPVFQYRVDAGRVMGFGKARSKKEAKHEAAKDALAKFTELGLYIPDQTATTTPPMQQTSPIKQEPETTLFQINAVGMLKDFVAEHKLPPPEFAEVSDVGPAHQRLFTLQCTVGNLKKTATEYTKKKAKQACAQLMYQCLLDSLPDITDADDPNCLCVDEGPAFENILHEFSNTSINFNKKKENYKLVIAEYPQTFNKLMEEKDISFDDLWRNIHEYNEKTLELLLNQFDLKFTIDSFENEDDFMIVLTIDSEPNFCVAKVATSIPMAMPYLIADAFEFLKLMTRQ